MGELTVGVREAKRSLSALMARANESGEAITVLKHGRPWAVISPADAQSLERRQKRERLRRLTREIESTRDEEPSWDESVSDAELLGEERMRRFG